MVFKHNEESKIQYNEFTKNFADDLLRFSAEYGCFISKTEVNEEQGIFTMNYCKAYAESHNFFEDLDKIKDIEFCNKMAIELFNAGIADAYIHTPLDNICTLNTKSEGESIFKLMGLQYANQHKKYIDLENQISERLYKQLSSSLKTQDIKFNIIESMMIVFLIGYNIGKHVFENYSKGTDNIDNMSDAKENPTSKHLH